jgi:hypothetical protein
VKVVRTAHKSLPQYLQSAEAGASGGDPAEMIKTPFNTNLKHRQLVKTPGQPPVMCSAQPSHLAAIFHAAGLDEIYGLRNTTRKRL